MTYPQNDRDGDEKPDVPLSYHRNPWSEETRLQKFTRYAIQAAIGLGGALAISGALLWGMRH